MLLAFSSAPNRSCWPQLTEVLFEPKHQVMWTAPSRDVLKELRVNAVTRWVFAAVLGPGDNSDSGCLF